MNYCSAFIFSKLGIRVVYIRRKFDMAWDRGRWDYLIFSLN
jgi:hypothetical protein